MSASGGKSSTSSVSNAQSNSFIDPTQMGFLTNLWSQATGQANPNAARGAAEGVAGTTMPGLGAAFGNIGGLTDPKAQIDAQTASLQSGLGQMFREEINPAIGAGAMGAGGFGGARHGVAQGVGAGQIAQAFTQARGDIVARANQTAIGAGSLLPDLAAALQGQGQAGQTAAMDALGRLAGILGGPTVLNRSVATSKAGGKDAKFGFSLFG